MATRYRIYAQSAQANERQQSMDLIDDQFLSDRSYAEQHALSFATRLNNQRFLGAIDWQGSTEAYEYQENFLPFTLPARPQG